MREAAHPDGHAESSAVPPAEVEKALSEILQSTPFRSTKQIQKLLQFIVWETLAGRADTLKERNIGATIFDRPPDYDTNSDPTVRLRVAELRKRLAVYYRAMPAEPVLISVPSGSFRAVFEWAGRTSVPALPLSGQEVGHAHEGVEPASGPASHILTDQVVQHPIAGIGTRHRWIAITASLALIAVALVAYFPSSEERAFTKFWAPVLRDPHPVLIHIGNNTVYELSSSFADEYSKQHPPDNDQRLGFYTYFSFPPGTRIPAEDLFPAKDVYHTNGDVTAAIAVTSVLVRRKKQFDVRYGSDITYGDLRGNPAILIGAHNNFWTLSMTQNLRFRFDGPKSIVDHSNPQKRWVANADLSEDYAIVSRVLNSPSGRGFITVAGVGQGGTSAAADFLTNPVSLSLLIRSLPKDWEKKNIQVVLHTTVKNQVPSAPDVLAIYSW